MLAALDQCTDALAADFRRIVASLRSTVAESASNTLEHARLYDEIATTVQARMMEIMRLSALGAVARADAVPAVDIRLSCVFAVQHG